MVSLVDGVVVDSLSAQDPLQPMNPDILKNKTTGNVVSSLVPGGGVEIWK